MSKCAKIVTSVEEAQVENVKLSAEYRDRTHFHLVLVFTRCFRSGSFIWCLSLIDHVQA